MYITYDKNKFQIQKDNQLWRGHKGNGIREKHKRGLKCIIKVISFF